MKSKFCSQCGGNIENESSGICPQCEVSPQTPVKQKSYFIPMTIVAVLFVSGLTAGYEKLQATGRSGPPASVTVASYVAPPSVDISADNNSDIMSVTEDDVFPDPQEAQGAKDGTVRELIVALKQQGTGNYYFDNIADDIYSLAKQQTEYGKPFGYLDFTIDVPEEDQYGNIQVQDAVEIIFGYSDLRRINWKNFNKYMLLNLAYSKSESPDANGPPGTGALDMYGSQEIIKPWCAQYGSIGAATFCSIFGY